MDDSKTRYCFLAEWFDIHAQLTRNYELLYYPSDRTVEMYDVKQRRTFLKRTKSNFKLQDFFVGAVLNVLSRQLTIRGFGDEYTRVQLETQLERSIAIVKNDAYNNTGEILDYLTSNGFSLCRARMLLVTKSIAEAIGSSDKLSSAEISSLEGGLCTAFEVIKPGAVESLKRFAGPDSVEEAQKSSPNSLHAKYGLSGFKNGVHVAKSFQSAIEQISLIFDGQKIQRTAAFKNSTLALIRPHALLSGAAGKIIDAILQAKYLISDLELFQLDRANAEEFIEVYKGILPEYHLILDELTSGPLIALEISGDENIATQFRDFAGPSDPELGKQIRPNSLRSRFGIDKVKNALHVTDLPEDGILETQYFFKILVS